MLNVFYGMWVYNFLILLDMFKLIYQLWYIKKKSFNIFSIHIKQYYKYVIFFIKLRFSFIC